MYYITLTHQFQPSVERTSQYRPCVDEAPYFSWVITSDEKNVMQTSYHITVKNMDEVMWDSGMVESDKSIFVEYSGKPLQSLSDYNWTVEVTVNNGEKAAASSSFETGFMKKEWTAEWVKSPFPMKKVKPGTGGQNPAEYFRKEFDARDGIKRARVYATCHGAYQLSMNGMRPDDREFAPEFTVYSKYLCYQTYDVTPFLREGGNVIGMLVGDGWYDSANFKPRSRKFKAEHSVLFQIKIDYEDGTSEMVLSDDTVKVSESPIRSSDLFAGELYDARMEQENWNCCGFDDSSWKTGIPCGKIYVNLVAQYGEPVRPVKEVPAVGMTVSPKGETIIDFGQNLAGVLRVKSKLPAGTKMVLDHFETLDQYGNYFNNIFMSEKTGHKQSDIYISNGKFTEYIPHFTYHGFRYVRVTGGADWKKEDFTALAISTENEVTGNFQCSDEQINQLQSNIYWSQRSNNITIPTDCPTREKAGWTGDVVVYGATALYNQNMTAFYEDWLRSIRLDQLENGYVLGTVPQIRNYVQQGDTGSLGWGDVILTLPLQLYQLYGDKEVLQANYEAMEEWMQSMERAAHELPSEAVPYGGSQTEQNCDERSLENQRYLINTGFHFGDWIIPSVVNEEGFTDGPASAFLTMNYVGSSLLAADADMFSEISELVGNMENAEKYCAYANRVRQAFEEEYVSEDGKLGQEMQGNYILALRHHMVSPEKEPLLAERLNELVVKNGFRLDTGFMATPHILDILCQYGYADTAWKVLLQKQCPSWLYEVEQGATTVWENWDAVRPDGKLAGCSFNHYAFGCVGDFLYRKVLGIQNTGIGYDKILIAPEYDCPFKWAEGTYHSVNGNIELRWEKNKNQVKVSGRIPANTSACLKLPDGTEKELGNGWFEVKAGLDSGIKE